jgi:hypothetical protein
MTHSHCSPRILIPEPSEAARELRRVAFGLQPECLGPPAIGPSGWDGFRPLSAPAHIALHGRLVPEGLVLIAACRYCGGRSESLVDMRPDFGESVFGRDVHPVVALCAEEMAGEAAIVAEVDRLTLDWAPLHASCEAAPRSHVARPEAHALLDAAVRAAATRVAAGGHVPATMYVVLGNDSYAAGEIRRPPDAIEEETGGVRDIERAVAQYCLRETVRANGIDVTAVLAVVERRVAANDRHVSREPRSRRRRRASRGGVTDSVVALQVGLITEGYGLTGVAQIRRDGPGNRCLEPLRLRPMWAPHPLIDGVMAARRVIRLAL